MTTAGWDGDDYQSRFDALASTGADMHGEANLVRYLLWSRIGLRGTPASVLDAGCGTGRVAIELATTGHDSAARRGELATTQRDAVDVIGVDVDPSMLATARRLRPDLAWVQADLAAIELGSMFDVVVMAGNVLLFTAPGAQAGVVAGCARHVATDGWLVAGFELGRGYELVAYDRQCEAAGLVLSDRWATWDRRPWRPKSGYAVSAHRRVSR